MDQFPELICILKLAIKGSPIYDVLTMYRHNSQSSSVSFISSAVIMSLQQSRLANSSVRQKKRKCTIYMSTGYEKANMFLKALETAGLKNQIAKSNCSQDVQLRFFIVRVIFISSQSLYKANGGMS